jgi:hypothetical protein
MGKTKVMKFKIRQRQAEEASRVIAKCACGKFRELSTSLTARKALLKVKVYKTCVQTGLVYGSKTWAMQAQDMQRLERTKRMVIRCMCVVKPSAMKAKAELLSLVEFKVFQLLLGMVD